MSLKGISNILPLNSENLLKIIRTAKHPAYSDSRFYRQQTYLIILILRKVRFRKVETNRAYSTVPTSQLAVLHDSSNTQAGQGLQGERDRGSKQ